MKPFCFSVFRLLQIYQKVFISIIQQIDACGLVGAKMFQLLWMKSDVRDAI